MTTQEERLRIARQIVDWEARRDSQGRLKIYELPPGDGGGMYEVAGINDRYHPLEARQLKELIEQGRFNEAEAYASAYIAAYTDAVARWTDITSIEAFLRDSCFNRGFVGAARIFQIALDVEVDGVVGPITLRAAGKAEAQPRTLLQSLRKAREKYERIWVGRDESSRFWEGLVNRWNKVLKFSLSLLPSFETDTDRMNFLRTSDSKATTIFEDLNIGDEQVTSNECWEIPHTLNESEEDTKQPIRDLNMSESQAISSKPERVYQDLDFGDEQVTSNECYQEEE